ncbi:hypothetical protein CQ12_22500 [Bradyrhizobium jicamae]|uniref:Uncharacterized protein n=1 Tax=Bradyrhizobium jicamae TaxID=280332 RepID=A0A0R3KJ45_9BRAD|nr:hypothetical protein [Bradyrhizobium jicamae]KRQ93308.1 hypothetical protein CQ12_22500 [Bradyrhizobium jicamae]
MTVFVCVNASKQVDHPEHIKVFANQDAAEKWFEENDPKGVALNTQSSNERGRQVTAHSTLAILGLLGLDGQVRRIHLSIAPPFCPD